MMSWAMMSTRFYLGVPWAFFFCSLWRGTSPTRRADRNHQAGTYLTLGALPCLPWGALWLVQPLLSVSAAE